ncbi:MAG TPA: O-antigen ligase family protein [Actinophytocola sp.]|uniref:O-antigen ligase family protein n=1 Tax=Actinophytocola sp. TaxID=1872138 RepID=UPI002DDD9C13|nr:O-antigen ligase family protein [Actinophytocola sp.]HEV2779861.1 O-antigen ligase family protein [Actinophytocola sp.]
MTDFLSPPRQRADGATLAVLFVVALLVIPARLVLRGVPLALTPASVIAMLVGLVWLCAQFTTTLGVAKGRNVVRTGLFCYAAALLATYGYSTFGYLPADELSLADHAIVLLIAVVGLALGVCDGVRGADRMDFVLKAVVVCGAISATVGIVQFLFNLDLTQFLKLPMLRYESGETLIEVERNGLRRVGGTMGHPIEFGVVLAMILPLAAHYGFQARERSRPALRWWVCAGLIATGLMFSASRSAMVGIGGVAIVLLIGWPARRRVRALLIAAGFLVLMKLAVPGLITNMINLFANAGTDDSVKWRTWDYPAATTEILRHLWFGRGYGTWYAPKHQVFDNQYILTMVEGGVIGMAAFVAVFACGIYAAIRFRYLSDDRSRRDLGLTIAASLVVPLLGSATFDLVAFKTAEGLSFLLIGAAGALLRITAAERAAAPPTSRPRSPAR